MYLKSCCFFLINPIPDNIILIPSTITAISQYQLILPAKGRIHMVHRSGLKALLLLYLNRLSDSVHNKHHKQSKSIYGFDPSP